MRHTIFFALLAACACARAQPPPQCIASLENDAWPPPMVKVQAGNVTLGEGARYPEETPPTTVFVDTFWIDRYEVTNAQFARFVAATGYVTEAERQPAENGGPGSAVFGAGGRTGWSYVSGADWRHPSGPFSNIVGQDDYPVVHVTHADAEAYAKWLNRSLPTEAQFERVASLGAAHRDASLPTHEGRWIANTWQGAFPFHDDGSDGFVGPSPVGCFGIDAAGAADLIGNVWEWTSTPYDSRHSAADALASQHAFAYVIKGGSYLCAPNFCARFTPYSRQSGESDLSASHIGFRTVSSSSQVRYRPNKSVGRAPRS